MTIYKWSQTASADATADGTINWTEGQAPSSVNDSARAMMAATAKYRDDIAGAIVTTGTNTSYFVSSYQGFDTLVHLNGQMIAFTPHATNGASGSPGIFLNVDSLGAKPLRTSPGIECQPGTIIQGTPYVAVYNNSDGAFYLQGLYGNPYNVPLGAGLDYWASIAPNTSFAFPVGQAISRSIYATLFSLVGTMYGTGDGSTTFNLPDKTGRTSVMADPGGIRVTGNTFNTTTAGGVGGVERISLATGNLPPYTPSGSISTNVTIANNQSAINVGSGANGSGSLYGPFANQGVVYTNPSASSSFAGAAQGGTSSPFTVLQPSIICNYILRII